MRLFAHYMHAAAAVESRKATKVQRSLFSSVSKFCFWGPFYLPRHILWCSTALSHFRVLPLILCSIHGSICAPMFWFWSRGHIHYFSSRVNYKCKPFWRLILWPKTMWISISCKDLCLHTKSGVCSFKGVNSFYIGVTRSFIYVGDSTDK